MLSLKHNSENQKQTVTVDLKPTDLEQIIVQIKQFMFNTEDLKVKRLSLHGQLYAVMFIDSLVKLGIVQVSVIEPLVTAKEGHVDQALHSADAKQSSNLAQIGYFLLEGYCVVVKANVSTTMLLPAAETHVRSIQEPKDEQVIKGSHDGFIEGISTNLYLLRRRVKSPN